MIEQIPRNNRWKGALTHLHFSHEGQMLTFDALLSSIRPAPVPKTCIRLVVDDDPAPMREVSSHQMRQALIAVRRELERERQAP